MRCVSVWKRRMRHAELFPCACCVHTTTWHNMDYFPCPLMFPSIAVVCLQSCMHVFKCVQSYYSCICADCIVRFALNMKFLFYESTEYLIILGKHLRFPSYYRIHTHTHAHTQNYYIPVWFICQVYQFPNSRHFSRLRRFLYLPLAMVEIVDWNWYRYHRHWHKSSFN